MKPSRRLLPVLSISLIALLIFAASAAAEVRSGEGTSPPNPNLPEGLDLLKATANYDSSTGAVAFTTTTSASPTQPEDGELFIGLLTTQGPCDASVFAPGMTITPFLYVRTSYTPPSNPNEAAANYFFFEKQPAEGEQPSPVTGPASKEIDGMTTTLASTVPEAANRSFNCAVAETRKSSETKESDFIVFPVAVQAPPEEVKPTPPTQTPSPTVEVQTVTKTVSPPPPAAAALSLPRIKPVSAGTEKWTTVRLAVTNTGGTAAGPVSLKVEAPRGVLVKPATLKLPALLPGQTWTLPVRVKATEAAKKVSTLTLTATLPGIAATSSIVVKKID